MTFIRWKAILVDPKQGTYLRTFMTPYFVL